MCLSEFAVKTSNNVENGYSNKDFQCKICPNAYSVKEHLMKHLQAHKEEKPWHCYFCSMSFSTNSRLKRHEIQHTAEKPFQWKICSMSFSRNEGLKRHDLRFHTGEKRFQCGHCSEAFSNKTTHHKHMKSEHGEKPYKCDDCVSAFSRQCELRVHRKTHDEKFLPIFKCRICPVIVHSNRQLKTHFKLHVGEKPYECDICPSTFNKKHSLFIHKRIHSGHTSVTCANIRGHHKNIWRAMKEPTLWRGHTHVVLASNAFKTKQELRQHAIVHSHERTFKCDICQSSFKRKEYLKKHKDP